MERIKTVRGEETREDKQVERIMERRRRERERYRERGREEEEEGGGRER